MIRDKNQKIATCIKAIPEGKVASYGQIASLAGIQRGHRVVARFVKQQTEYPQLPWHRLLRADGKLGFPVDSEKYHTQLDRLKSEGVLLRNNKIDMTAYGWQPDLDFILFHPEL